MLQKQLLKQSDKNKSGKKKNSTVADTTDSNKPPHDGMVLTEVRPKRCGLK